MTQKVEIADRMDILSARIRRGLSVGADRSSLHDAIVDSGDATEEEFFLAYTFASLAESPPTARSPEANRSSHDEPAIVA